MIFILGGNGFVGSAFTRYCARTGMPHTPITRQNYAEHRGKSCDILIASHGNASRLLSMRNPGLDYRQSVTAIRDALFDFDYRRFVLISSCDVYPDCSSPKTTVETMDLDASRQSTYGLHKHLAERLVVHHAEDWLIARLGGMVGDGLKKNPIYDILHGGPLFVDPSSEMQFINTDDVARIVMRMDGSGGVFNICGDGRISLDLLLGRYGRVDVKAGSPAAVYDVNVDRIKEVTQLPRTSDSVIAYCDLHAAGPSAQDGGT